MFYKMSFFCLNIKLTKKQKEKKDDPNVCENLRPRLLHPECWGSLSTSWKRISRHGVLQKRVSLLGTKNRYKMITVSAEGLQLLMGQGESTVFMGQ